MEFYTQTHQHACGIDLHTKIQQGASRQDLRLWERQNWQLLIEMDVFRGHVFVHAGK